MSLIIGGTLAYLFLPRPWWIIVVFLLAGFEVFEVMLWLRWRRRRSTTGIHSMVGTRGVLAATEGGLSGRARVRIRGTTFPARVLEGAPGDPVVVEGVEGMTLVVRAAKDAAAG